MLVDIPGAALVVIVVAWIEEVQIVVPGQSWRHDLGEIPKFETFRVGRAVMWLNSGTNEDVAKARDWISKHYDTGRVFAYPVMEPDPLDRARREILA